MSSHASHAVAVVQHSPIWLDRAATLERAVDLVREAARNGARLIAFPEAFVAGYPIWVWKLRTSDNDIAMELYARLLSQAVDLSSDDLRPLLDAARSHKVTIVCGVNECDRSLSGTTLYNTVVLIGPDGRLLNRHRKLMPTNSERIVWAMGDASGLAVTETAGGKVGSLICWENYMPLARFALYAQGVEIHVAPTWDQGDRWVSSMRHIASEGRCWVLGSGSAMTNDDIPDGTPGRDRIIAGDDGWINNGDSVIVNPEGEIVAGPLRQEAGILYAECDPAVVARSRYWLDVAGHYGRPDIFRLQINREARLPIEALAASPTIATSDSLHDDGNADGAIATKQDIPLSTG